MRASGILLPVFSLPSATDIGDMYRSAYKFIDRLHEAGQRYWQILPMNPINEENCPYQSSSCFAGEPLFISLQKLCEQKLLTEDEALSLQKLLRDEMRIDYDAVRPAKTALLRKAHQRFAEAIEEESVAAVSLRKPYEDFCRQEDWWLDDYALFMALADHYAAHPEKLADRECGNQQSGRKTQFRGGDWLRWEADIRDRKPEAMARWTEELKAEIAYYKWTQYEFYKQWDALRRYANDRDVRIIGDVPCYLAYESANCWSRPELFQIQREGLAKAFVAGAPPDGFSAEGQCWGNPVYNWNVHKAENYIWWIIRLRHQLRMFDVVRIDHMRGFESYYAIPAETEDPRDGHWEKGPGVELFDAIREALGDCPFIAEDLGYLTPAVREMMDQTGFPGMKILQFAFDTSEENIYLPFNYDTDHAVVYTGTHDNDTTLGWYAKAEDWKRRFVTWYLKEKSEFAGERIEALNAHNQGTEEEFDEKTATRGLIELAQSTRCDTCIIPMQDYLLLDSDARINLPGQSSGNWNWKMPPDAFTEELAASIKKMCERYNRK